MQIILVSAMIDHMMMTTMNDDDDDGDGDDDDDVDLTI